MLTLLPLLLPLKLLASSKGSGSRETCILTSSEVRFCALFNPFYRRLLYFLMHFYSKHAWEWAIYSRSSHCRIIKIDWLKKACTFLWLVLHAIFSLPHGAWAYLMLQIIWFGRIWIFILRTQFGRDISDGVRAYGYGNIVLLSLFFVFLESSCNHINHVLNPCSPSSCNSPFDTGLYCPIMPSTLSCLINFEYKSFVTSYVRCRHP